MVKKKWSLDRLKQWKNDNNQVKNTENEAAVAFQTLTFIFQKQKMKQNLLLAAGRQKLRFGDLLCFGFRGDKKGKRVKAFIKPLKRRRLAASERTAKAQT